MTRVLGRGLPLVAAALAVLPWAGGDAPAANPLPVVEQVWLGKRQVIAEGGQALSGTELRKLLTGKTCSVTRREGVPLLATFTPDGMVLSEQGFVGYRITDDGEVCYESKKGKTCQTVVRTSGGYRVFDADGEQRSIVTC